MRYCKRCLYPENHPLGIVFDADGVCSGCRVHEEKDALIWSDRLLELRRIAGSYRSRKRNIHDCIIPVSGARDSYYIVHFVKNILRLNPLLVAYNKQYNTKVGIRNLAYLQTVFDCDIIQSTVSPDTVRRLTRETLRVLGSMYWHCIAGQTVFPVQTAAKFKIPLIIWGAHQGLEQVGMYSHLDCVEMTRKYRKEHDLMGIEAEDLVGGAANLSACDLAPYMYPHDGELAAVGVRGIYLGNYVRWDSKAQHEEMIRLYGYETAAQLRTFDAYNDVDSFHYSGLHDYIKFLKWGYGKVTDHASREIRFGRLSRQQGVALVRRYEGVQPADLPLFLDWIGMGAEELFALVDEFRDRRVWGYENGRWTLIDSVAREDGRRGVCTVECELASGARFMLTPPRDVCSVEDGYVLIGRGFVDR